MESVDGALFPSVTVEIDTTFPIYQRERHTLKTKTHYGITATNLSVLFCSHVTRTAGWLPPAEAWKWGEECLPYGWERAVDNSGRPYYIKWVVSRVVLLLSKALFDIIGDALNFSRKTSVLCCDIILPIYYFLGCAWYEATTPELYSIWYCHFDWLVC